MQHEAELQSILKQVEVLDADERRWLSRQIGVAGNRPLATRSDEEIFTPPVGRLRTDEEKRELRLRFFERYAPGLPTPEPPEPSTPEELAIRKSLAGLRGIANPSGKSYTEEDIDRIRFEAIAEKHLRSRGA